MSNFIGPALPPHLVKSVSASDDSDVENNKKVTDSSQKDVLVGPSLPPYMQTKPQDIVGSDCNRDSLHVPKKQHTESESTDSTDLIGPQLPPHISISTKFDQITEIGPNLSREKHSNSKEATIGPSLPLKLRTKLARKSSENTSSSDEEQAGSIGPVLPPHLRNSDSEDDTFSNSRNVCVIGPRLPPFLTSRGDKQSYSEEVGYKNDKTPKIGPFLPAHLQSKFLEELPTVVEEENNSKPVLGPSLPDHVKLTVEVTQEKEDDEYMYGPALPPGFHPKTVSMEVKTKENAHESDEDMGPLPEGHMSGSRIQHQLEIRAKQLRESMAMGDNSESNTPVQRESWMLELPADRAPELGLKPRQFRMREGPEAGDRSVWTDTPADRERKIKNPKSKSPDRGALEQLAVQERDKAMQQLADQHSSKRGSRSLMELHEEKLLAKRKKAEKDGEVQERRPFSREVDLQVNRFDEAQKRSILKKAHHLNDRFSSGQSKFL